MTTTTRGLGSGGDPDVGRRSAEEDEAKDRARRRRVPTLVFVTAGLGAAPVRAPRRSSPEMRQVNGALTIAVVTKPFAFEGSRSGGELPKRRRRTWPPTSTPYHHGPRTIGSPTWSPMTPRCSMRSRRSTTCCSRPSGASSTCSAGPGLIDLDFADVRTVMQGAGPALIGLGRGSGENRALDAARQAIASPLLEGQIEGAHGILFNVSWSRRPPAARGPPRGRGRSGPSADPDAYIIFGASLKRVGRRADVLDHPHRHRSGCRRTDPYAKPGATAVGQRPSAASRRPDADSETPGAGGQAGAGSGRARPRG